MKGVMFAFSVAAMLCAASVAGAKDSVLAMAYDGSKLSLRAEHAPLRAVLGELAGKMHVKARVSAAVDGEVNDRFERLPVEKAFRRLFHDYNTAMQWDDKHRLIALDVLPKGEKQTNDLEAIEPAPAAASALAAAHARKDRVGPVGKRETNEQRMARLNGRVAMLQKRLKSIGPAGDRQRPDALAGQRKRIQAQLDQANRQLAMLSRHRGPGAKNPLAGIDPELVAHRRPPRNAMEAQQLQRALARRRAYGL